MNARNFLPIPSYIKFVTATNPPVTNETFTVNAFETVYVNATYNSLILQPNANPKNGDSFTVIDCLGISETHNISIDPNTQKVNNSTGLFILADNYAIVNFYFYNGNWNINYGGLFGYTKDADTLNGLSSSDFSQTAFSTISVSGEGDIFTNPPVSGATDVYENSYTTGTTIPATLPEDKIILTSDKNISILTNGKIISINISDILDANTLNGHAAKDFTRNGFTSIRFNGITYTATKPNDFVNIDGS